MATGPESIANHQKRMISKDGYRPKNQESRGSRFDLSAVNLWHSIPKVVPESIADVSKKMKIFDDGVISVLYAPFSHINNTAKLVIVGITPGWQQTQIGYRVVSQNQGHPRNAVEQEVKRQAAFAGSMRSNLVTMLDGLSIPHFLEIGSTSELFGRRFDLVHSTSVLRFPVFKNGDNYSGHSPNPLRHSFLLAMVEQLLAPELNSIPKALVIPLGKSVESVMEYLVRKGVIPEGRLLRGFPHPSGANGHRLRLYNSLKGNMATQVKEWFK